MCNSHAHTARFIGEQCLVTVGYIMQERREECCCNLCVNATRSANVAAEILLNTSSVNVAGTSPLTASTKSSIAHLVSLFEVIPIEHKVFRGATYIM